MLKTRIITALLLTAVFIPAMFFLPNNYWAIVTLLVSLLAVIEWAKMIDLKQSAIIFYILVYILIGGLFIWTMITNGFHLLFYQSLMVFEIAALFWAFVMFVWIWKRFVFNNKWGMALIGYLIIISFWLALVCAKAAEPTLLLVLMITIWIADSAAYFSGKSFGKHKLAPNISPGKTWEGVLGALIAVTAFAYLLYFGFGIDNIALFPLLLIVTILGVIGDLFESMMKRQANIKDSGNILPGHGGVLDRIDGLIPSLPLAILIIYFYHFYR